MLFFERSLGARLYDALEYFNKSREDLSGIISDAHEEYKRLSEEADNVDRIIKKSEKTLKALEKILGE